ncbi:MAG TPA: T9SS type A sorting domain-containing protein, partial [Chitinophagaceae bacterium]
TRLVWKVEEEIGVNVFEIERSNDGSRFENIASIDAMNAGTYFHNDDHIPVHTTFYRLRILDHDGSVTFSNIVSINAKPVTTVRLRTNPVRDLIFLEHPPSLAGTRLHFYDITGSLVRQHNIPELTTLTTLDVSTIPAGVYVVTITGKTIRETLKIVKRH